MLHLDHLPFYARRLETLTETFAGLGFRVSPAGAYTSPQDPSARWAACCVPLARGWFELLQSSDVPEGQVGGPAACLYLTDDLPRAVSALGPQRTRGGYKLVRRWDTDLGLPPATFEIVPIREAGAPLPLALIAHAEPSPDILPSWREHPNGAEALLGLTFPASPTDQAPEPAFSLLPAGTLRFAPAETFRADFGDARVAARVRVRSLETAATSLHREFKRAGDRLLVPAAGALGCAFEFV